MRYQTLIFDLDGTISDPKPGFVNSINHALAFHDLPARDETELKQHIGPPLETTLAALVDSDDPALIHSLVGKYRERYADIGYSENSLYTGIPNVLEALSGIDGLLLGVCTSKRADFAERILDMFGLRHHFAFVSGGDVGIAKWQQLESLLEQQRITTDSLMIGDRHFDLTAAHRNYLASAGVLWGYGSLVGRA